MAVEVEDVEDEVGEGLAYAILECGLEVGEAGGAVVGEDDYFAVGDEGVSGEGCDAGRDAFHAVGPIEAGAS